MKRTAIRYSFLIMLILPLFAHGQASMKMSAGQVDAARWIETRFARGKVPPFSFVYGDKSSKSLLPGWNYSMKRLPGDDPDVVKYLYTYTERPSGLKVECFVTGFPAFDAVEWVLHFTNTGKSDSRVLEQVKVVDLDMQAPAAGDFTLYYADGNHISKEDFHPRTTVLSTTEPFRMAPEGGRSSQGDFLPFFNLTAPSGKEGVVVGIGWTGMWYADLTKTGDRGATLVSGMKTMRLYLHPDESIRTPSISLMFWNGDDRMAGHNRFRRFVLAHHTRKVDGQMQKYPLCSGFNYRDPAPCTEYSCLTADWAIAMVKRYKQFGLVPEVFWLDAGWHTGAADYKDGKSWANTTGNWTVDTTRFPDGLKPVADAVHETGAKFMVWFEPERVIKGTQWAVEHPDWMLDLPSEPDGTYLLFDLGNKEAREWLCRYIGDLIERNGIDYYRQDFNMEPDKYWAAHDEAGRTGMKEIRHVEGLYAFWDYLLERFPGLLIDNCERRPPARPGDDLAQRTAVAQRLLPLRRSGRLPGAHLRTEFLPADPRNRDLADRRIFVPVEYQQRVDLQLEDHRARRFVPRHAGARERVSGGARLLLRGLLSADGLRRLDPRQYLAGLPVEPPVGWDGDRRGIPPRRQSGQQHYGEIVGAGCREAL
mgnify:CR=1 FL=1